MDNGEACQPDSSWQKHISLPRAKNVTNTHVSLAFAARFYDELASGLPDVLMPTIQAQLGLSLAQVGLLRQVLDYVGVAIEPFSSLLIDVWQRKWLMGFGALGICLSMITVGMAPTFLWLIIAYAIFGLASGPLAHTADVIIVESYPDVPDRAFARSTLIDTTGALLAPLSVTLFIWQDWPWHWLVIGVGLLGLIYGALILHNGLPPPGSNEDAEKQSLFHTLRNNLTTVLQDQEALRWLLLLFAFSLLELPMILKTIWLAQEVGMSQALIGLYVAAEMAVGIVSLVLLDQWRQRTTVQRVLQWVTVSVAILYPIWLLTPSITARFLLMIPLTLAFTMFWPILKASSLASVPGRAGAVSAVSAFFGILPLPLLFGLLAQQVGLTWAMLGVHIVSIGLVSGLIFWRRN